MGEGERGLEGQSSGYPQPLSGQDYGLVDELRQASGAVFAQGLCLSAFKEVSGGAVPGADALLYPMGYFLLGKAFHLAPREEKQVPFPSSPRLGYFSFIPFLPLLGSSVVGFGPFEIALKALPQQGLQGFGRLFERHPRLARGVGVKPALNLEEESPYQGAGKGGFSF